MTHLSSAPALAGYAAAFYAADRGLTVALVDREVNPGGVCVYRGCIPSKALLHVAKLVDEAAHASAWGVDFGKPAIDVNKLRAFKDKVVTTAHERHGPAREGAEDAVHPRRGDDHEPDDARRGADGGRAPSR